MRTEKNMEYSVLMAVYQKEDPAFFRNSIQSVLNQTISPTDFVLVCDGPLTQGLEEVIVWAEALLGSRMQCIRLKQNEGLGKALRTGLPYCRCACIARMDSDDISRSNRMERQLTAMLQGNYDIVSAWLEEFNEVPGDSGRIRQVPETGEEIAQYLKKRNPFNHPCVMFRKEAVLEAGGYQDFPWFEDYYLWARMLERHARGYNLPEVLLDMRAGKGMYDRRGGMAYLKSVIRFQFYLRKAGFNGLRDCLKNCVIRVTVALIPRIIREKFYGAFLRK
ncbi:MAG: glycosyltransferase [Blautia sp.]|nr:glycosyltransferase [Blautia sp.]